MCAAFRLGNDLVDDSLFLKMLRCEAQTFCRLVRSRRVFPENRPTTLRTEPRVTRVLEHHHLIADADRECSSRSTFADHSHDDRHLDLCHLAQVVRDGFGLPAFFRVDSRIRARSVDEGEDRTSKLLTKLHHAQRLSITFGLGHAEVSITALLRVATLLMTDDYHGQAVKSRQPTPARRIFRKSLVAMKLDKVFKQTLDEIERVRAILMTSELHALKRRSLLGGFSWLSGIFFFFIFGHSSFVLLCGSFRQSPRNLILSKLSPIHHCASRAERRWVLFSRGCRRRSKFRMRLRSRPDSD